MYNSFLYIVTNEGIDTNNAYPYQGKVNKGQIYKSTCHVFSKTINLQYRCIINSTPSMCTFQELMQSFFVFLANELQLL